MMLAEKLSRSGGKIPLAVAVERCDGWRMKHGVKRILAIGFFLLGCGSATAEEADFIRVQEDAAAARLQTGVTRYTRGEISVDLLGAVHIADKAYYKALEKRFGNYDSLLFEMIGGEALGRAAEIDPPEKPAEPAPETATSEPAGTSDAAAEENPSALAALHVVYQSVAEYLGLSGQADEIDYTARNFVHADLSAEEFSRKMRERQESLLTFALEAAKHAEKSPAAKPDGLRLLRAVLAGSANHVKLELVKSLGQGDDQVAALAGETVVISDRNARCMEVLLREISSGRKKLGIFYGAAHFPDLEKRLLAVGFQRGTHEWITAWEIPKRKSPAKPASRE